MLFLDAIKQEKFKVLFEGKSDLGDITKVRVKFTQADEKNGNGRIYPLALWQREVSRIQDDINAGGVLGMSTHPKDAVTDAGDVSHIVSKLELDKNGTGWAELKILDTTKGRNLKTVMKAGGRLGVSTRGFGTMDSNTGIVNDDYKLDNLDIVTNPSFKGGFFSQDSVFESLSLSEKKKTKTGLDGTYLKEEAMKNKLIEELKEDTEFSRVTKTLWENEENYTGTLLEYAEKNGLQIKAVLGVEEGTYPDYETAYMKLKAGEQKIADGKKMDSLPDRPAEPKDYYEESKTSGIHPEKMAEIVNKNRAKPGLTLRRIALRKQVLLSGKIGQTNEEIDAIVEKLLANESKTCKPAPLSENEQFIEKVKIDEQKKKKSKRLAIRTQMNRDGAMAGFKREQIDFAIARKMAELDEQEE